MPKLLGIDGDDVNSGMAVKFTVRPRVEPGVPGGGEQRYYAILAPQERVGLRELSTRIARNTSLSRTDVHAVIEALLEHLPQELQQGHTVDLGDFGTFKFSISSQGEDRDEAVTAHSITGNRLLFRPGSELRQALDDVTYQRESSTPPDTEF